jgi:hypothetical protein
MHRRRTTRFRVAAATLAGPAAATAHATLRSSAKPDLGAVISGGTSSRCADGGAVRSQAGLDRGTRPHGAWPWPARSAGRPSRSSVLTASWRWAQPWSNAELRQVEPRVPGRGVSATLRIERRVDPPPDQRVLYKAHALSNTEVVQGSWAHHAGLGRQGDTTGDSDASETGLQSRTVRSRRIVSSGASAAAARGREATLDGLRLTRRRTELASADDTLNIAWRPRSP